ncbi:hypothetical protein Rs2_29969 [Raphanus sativus]|nr:hypothetical protein Rs2_29969 [Raphanus sativus]
MVIESSLRERAEFMAARTAKDSAMRGDSTQSDVAERETVETRSSMIQPNPAYPETGFHAASVQIEIPWSLGFGSIVIKGFAFGGGEEIIQDANVPESSPTGGKGVIFRAISHPRRVLVIVSNLIVPIVGASSQTRDA